jgi:hypothetical protein
VAIGAVAIGAVAMKTTRSVPDQRRAGRQERLEERLEEEWYDTVIASW